MKLSELQTKLQELTKEHGDPEVLIDGFEIDEVSWDDEEDAVNLA